LAEYGDGRNWRVKAGAGGGRCGTVLWAGASAGADREATGNCHWLVDLLAERGHELWVGRQRRRFGPSYVRQQKTVKRDAEHMLETAGGRAVSAHLDTVE